MKKIEYKSIIDSVLDVDDKSRYVKAIWAKTDVEDLDKDITVKGAFTKTISERGPSGKNAIWTIPSHMSLLEKAIGKPNYIAEEGNNLVTGTNIIKTTLGNDILEMYKDGLITEHSFGFSIPENRSEVKGNIRYIKETILYEGGPQLWGANPLTPTMSVGKSFTFEEQKTELNKRLERLYKAWKNGTYTDETFSLIEIEIKQIQQAIEEITTYAAPKDAPTPVVSKSLLDAINNFNKIIKL